VQLQFTSTFSEEYVRLSVRDAAAVDVMLDTLEAEHSQPHMRNGINVGAIALFATPRFETPSGIYRITWQYAGTDQDTIVCVTVARADVTRHPT
jgi:hypothetical protein